MNKAKKSLLFFGICLIILVLWFSFVNRENLENFTYGKLGTPICPSGSIARSGDCAGPCPRGQTPTNGGKQCSSSNALGGQGLGPAPSVNPIRCSGDDVLLNGMCYKPCSPGYVLKFSTDYKGVVCEKPSSTSPQEPSSTSPQQSSSTKQCNPSYKQITGGSLETKCFS